MNRIAGALVLVVFTQGLVGCGDSQPVSPFSPSPIAVAEPPRAPSITNLKVFVDPRSGFSTSEVRDANDQLVQFNTANELIWFDGSRLSGYAAQGNSIPAEQSCSCWLTVRFGIIAGERRAYLTADYGHDNPGTLVDLEVSGAVLIVKRTMVFAPGTYTLSGVISELTDNGAVPVEGAGVWRLNEEQTGWQVAETDRNGFYELRGLYDGGRDVAVIKDGYQASKTSVVVNGDTRFDNQLLRR